MDWLLSILQDVLKTDASKAVSSGLALLGALILAKLLKPWWERSIPWLRAWWGRRSAQGKIGAGAIGFVFLCAALGGAYIGTRKPPPPVAKAAFAILVADLEDDTNQSQTHRIRDSLETQFHGRGDIQILPRHETLALPSRDDLQTELDAAAAIGRAWLKEQNASVLVWGEVVEHNRVLRLRFLPAEGDGSAKSYALSQTMELPADFGGDLGGVLAAQAVIQIAPVYDSAGKALANLIAPVVDRLKPLAEKPPASFSDETRADLWNAYAAGEGRLGEERGDNARLASAIAFYKKALAIWTREKVPLDWAMTQNNLGLALSTLGGRESGTARLEEAVAAYRAALQERTRDKVPLQWAMTQNNLGTALGELGDRESSTARLEEAVAAFRAALLERTREKVPLDWAMTQDNLGHALSILGKRESGTARLEEAVAAFRAALLERTREKVPLDWAMTHNNLGAALWALGERESGTARLEEAVAAYRAALLEWTRERVPLDWAMTQNNLGTALWTLGEREAETDRAKGCATLKTAREYYAASLEVRRQAGASYFVERTQGNIAGLDGVMARRC